MITMRDGFRFVARIPYPITEPKSLLVASEVATMDFLRSHGIPVPKIFGYSVTANNSAGTEYIFMDLVRGKNLGNVWYNLTEQERKTIVTNLVRLETRLFSLRFPASGSLYYCDDLPDDNSRVIVPSPDLTSCFCIGPDTSLGLWYGKRLELSVNRSPYRDSLAVLTAGATKEIAYLEKFGRDLQPFQRLRRELYNYQSQSHLEHITSLQKYVQIAPHLLPDSDPALHRPTIRHPDLQPNSIFISDNLEIEGIIDWQHNAILPLFLQCGILESLQNYGDEISESLQIPGLPKDFAESGEVERLQQAELLRRRQLHYVYVKTTEILNPDHYHALTYEFSTLRRRLFQHSGDPWEGDNVTLKADLVALSRFWKELNPDAKTPCPVSFPDNEVAECLRLEHAQLEADEQFQACKEAIGVGNEGWVPIAHYDDAKERERKLKADALDAAETEEERQALLNNWLFDDFSEEEYV
ncbi:kinase-like protein [Aspergillus ambiguus]|uniref:kinase-like protein n=1 Tax=Aspergillus ambiguus TaxID=176160 RepID=UPI003CCD41DA